MIDIIEIDEHRRLSLDDYAADARFVGAVANLRAETARFRFLLDGRTIWMVNSTAKGGGVAEMLPRLCALITELGIDIKWAVIKSDREAFFKLTKRIHNLIHGDLSGGVELGPEDAALLEEVNRENADSLRPHLKESDILVVHDPQPLPLGGMLKKSVGLSTVWRCHIGLDQRTDATNSVWHFLRPYIERYDRAAFSMAEYIPGFLEGRASIVTPALDPYSHKNRHLLLGKTVGVLCNSGLQPAYGATLANDDEYVHKVKRVMPDGSTAVPGEVGLLFRPIVLQVSRWDRLKGWAPLLDGFIRMKQGLGQDGEGKVMSRNRHRIAQARLVLAGPDPASIADDPEGVRVFREICSRYRELDSEMQKDVIILQLPMQSRKQNALIVNALQRSAAVVVQNSLREGFGLTVTEAMWKHLAVLGSSACGIRNQIRDGIDGLITNDPEDPDEIANNLWQMLGSPIWRYQMGRSAQMRVYEDFLIFKQVSRYLKLALSALGTERISWRP
ncbi:MAG: glycosyltransferase [Deltaproteobacteria bacterium]|nr:glycosyltransferase [Deltaproteobacteria bacterium]